MEATKPIKKRICEKKTFCAVNIRLIPIKIHYFLYAAGVASLSPYLPLYAKQSGLSSTTIGILYLSVSVATVIAKPLFGCLVDKYRQDKLVAVVLLLISAVFYLILSFAPSIPEEENVMKQFHCINYQLDTEPINSTCFPGPERTTSCKIICTQCKNEVAFTECKEKFEQGSVNVTVGNNYTFVNPNEIICSANYTTRCALICPCDEWCCSSSNEYKTTTFWMFFICFLFVGISERVLRGLSDSMCFDVLKDKAKNYGKQRIWHAVGSCAAPFIAGCFLDITRDKTRYNYSVAIYISVIYMILDIFTLCKLDLGDRKEKKKSTSICKAMVSFFFQLRHFVFAIIVCIGGMMLGFDLVYYNLFMQEIGASRLIIGLSLAGGILTQVPLSFFSGRILEKIGHMNSLSLSLFCTAIRLLSIAHIYNPLWVLIPQIILRSLNELFLISQASYAKYWAPLGTDATLQQLTGLLYGGIGIGLGYGLGGLGFDYYGSRQTFIITSAISGTFAAAAFVFDRYSRFHYKNVREEVENVEISEVNSSVKVFGTESKQADIIKDGMKVQSCVVK